MPTIPTQLGPPKSMTPSLHRPCVMLVPLLLLFPPVRPLLPVRQRKQPQPRPARLSRRLPRLPNWSPRQNLAVEPASSTLAKGVVLPAPSPVTVPPVLTAGLSISTTAAIPTSNPSSGSIQCNRRYGIGVVPPRSMPAASASLRATVMPTVPSPARIAGVFIQIIVDRKSPRSAPGVAECCVVPNCLRDY